MSSTGVVAARPKRMRAPHDATEEAGAKQSRQQTEAPFYEGVVVTDPSMRLIAADAGAASILHQLRDPASVNGSAGILPEGVVSAIRYCQGRTVSAVKLAIPGDGASYKCRVFFAEARDEHSPALLITVHFQKLSSSGEFVDYLAAKYDLTGRERETLHLMALGMTGREIATKLNISANTVKVFVRLVMIKMGVGNRAALMAKLLSNENDNLITVP